MEDKVLKIATAAISVLFLSICGVMFLMPDLHERVVIAQEKRAEVDKQRNAEKRMSALELLDYNTEAAPKEEASFSEQLRIAIPEHCTMEDLKIKNEYLKDTITLLLPGQNEEFIHANPIIGGSNHVEDLSLWSNSKGLHIEITLDRIREPLVRIEKGYLYLDFAEPDEVYEKIVVIDPGHGGVKPGTVNGSVYEKTINMKIALQLKKLFGKQKEIGVYFTRLDDSDVGLQDRVRMANTLNADIFISIHQNALSLGNGSYVNGTEVLYDEKKTGVDHSSKKLAVICLEEVTGHLSSKNLGLAEGNQIFIIRESKVPVALIEVGFISNPQELEKLTSHGYQKKAAKGIYNAIIRAFEEGF